MPSETIRVAPRTYMRLKELSQLRGEPMTATMQAAVEMLYRERFFDQCDAAYARLKADPALWKEELEERRAWEATLGDGLEDA